MNKQSNRNAWKGLVAGVVGGVVASWTMDRFQYWWLSFDGGDERELQQAPSEGNREEPATVKTAAAISEKSLWSQSYCSRKRDRWSHCSLCSGHGRGRGVQACGRVRTRLVHPGGNSLWRGVLDGRGRRSLAFAWARKGPTVYPISTHAYALASHLVFGLTAEVVRSTVRRAL